MAAVLVSLLPSQSQAGVLEAGEESELCREGKKEWNAQMLLGLQSIASNDTFKVSFISETKPSRQTSAALNAHSLLCSPPT